MQPTESQLRQIYELLQENWRHSRLLYDVSLDTESVIDGCYLALFATPLDSSNPLEKPDYNDGLYKAYYIYPDGRYYEQ